MNEVDGFHYCAAYWIFNPETHTHALTQTHTHTRSLRGGGFPIFTLLPYEPSSSPDVSGISLSVWFCVCMCERAWGGWGSVYLGKGLGLASRLLMVAYQTKSWWFQRDTEPHMIPIGLNLHSTRSKQRSNIKVEQGNALFYDPPKPWFMVP